jgi:GAF domain-containing protein
MGRGPKPAKSKEAKPPVARRSSKDDGDKVRDLEKRLAAALEREADAQARETATAEILRVIASSPNDVQPVFDTIAENANSLLRGWGALVVRFDGELLHVAGLRAGLGASEESIRKRFPQPASQDTFSGAVVRDRAVKQIADVETDDDWISLREHARRQGWRANLGVPMLHDGQPIGVITVTRREPGAFSAHEVDLLKTFADQAVIAIENVRLFNETKEALEQQTATAEILRVISSSPTDVQPVFDAIVQSAVRLCAARFAAVFRFDGEMLHLGAHNFPPDVLEFLQRQYPMHPGYSQASGRTILSRAVVQIPDLLADPEYQHEWALISGWRSILGVPMLHEGVPIGAILINRAEPGPFPNTQVELLQTFADQAVIAIENVRLFAELQTSNRDLTEALDQQTATSEILRVISSSPTDVQPVFDTIVRSARRLLGGFSATLRLLAGDQMELVAFTTTSGSGDKALRSISQLPLAQDPMYAQMVRDCQPGSTNDTETDPRVGSMRREAARARGYRSVLLVPMLRRGSVIGAIAVTRSEPGPFTDGQSGLLQTFADQAVIAIENVQLFKELEARNRELTESLDRQTATAEILRVISSSPTDVQPVFDAIVRSASRLLGGAGIALTHVREGLLHRVAEHYQNGRPADAVNQYRQTYPRPLDHPSPPAVAVRTGQMFSSPDTQNDPRVAPAIRENAAAVGYRKLVIMPMLRDGKGIGAIHASRAEAGLFSETEIALLQTFADQAVIAIENVRLFKELQTSNRELTTALDKQTATSDILRVISQSQTDVQPVFDAIVTSAVRLLAGYAGALTLIQNQQIELAVLTSTDDAGDAAVRAIFPKSLQSVGAHSRAIHDRAPLNITDAHTDTRLADGERTGAVARGFRSWVVVPMLRDDRTVGTIGITRREAGGFTADEITLLQTFADQAVIAIENVRLFTELQGKNLALTQAHAQVSESLEQQTATSEILRVISRSQADARPVFESIAENAMRLFRAWAVQVYRLQGQELHLEAAGGGRPGLTLPEWAVEHEVSRSSYRGRSILDRAIIHVRDVLSDLKATDRAREWARADGWRSVINAPMLRDGAPIGLITVYRLEPGGFLPTEVELLKTFADQAVIAVENARLLAELHARTDALQRSVDQLTALGEVGRAVSSTLDLETVLTTIVSRAVQLAGLEAGAIYEYDEAAEVFHLRATQNLPEEFLTIARPLALPKGEGATGRLAVTREPVQIPDITAPDAYHGRMRDVLLRMGHRALLAVPLISEDHIVGGLVVNRREAGEFAPEVIDLLQTFATQAALAIQNARLFREIEEKSRQLEAASQHKSEFLANMSHELRTPLNAIIGFSEVLAEKMFGELNEKQEEYSKDIHASGQHLLSLINDILDLSKIEAGRMELELSDFHLPTALDSALTLVRERAGRRSIALHMNVDERLGQMRADERKVRQIVLNLLSNAIKFTPEGGRIEVGAAPKDGLVEVSVSDTGVGIAPEDQETVFEEFRQVGTADKKVEGTGLGLTLCRKFVELHGGQIWVKSELGGGSTFTFSLPVNR